jgi:hypothetical protein
MANTLGLATGPALVESRQQAEDRHIAIVATHEAGHGVASVALRVFFDYVRVDIKPEIIWTKAAGFHSGPHVELRKIAALVAGDAAVRLVWPDVEDTGNGFDYDRCDELIKQVPDRPPFREFHRRVTQLLVDHYDALIDTAEALLRGRSLSYAEVRELVIAHEVPRYGETMGKLLG